MKAAAMTGARPWDGYGDALRDLKALETASSVDGDLVGHEDRVARTTRDLAIHTGVAQDEVERMTVAARFHDIGKLRVDPEVLRKPGMFTPEERETMERHAEYGAETLSALPGVDPMMVDAARYHHERYDGRGYEGMAGDDIPLVARIVSIADVHDALVQKRCYKPARPEAEVLAMMTGDDAYPNTGRDAFDPSLLRSFVAMRLADRDFNEREDRRLAETGAADVRPGLREFSQSPVPASGHGYR
jgi:HD-GYP domain-containing protein (c-di-GMP phosphodiesterase class II)